MIDASSHPRCIKRLDINFTNKTDPLMNDYWAAVIVADFCDDEALEAFGGFNFDDRSKENGRRLLDRLEVCIAQRRHRNFRIEIPDGLVAMLGARGIRTSVLSTEQGYWSVAMALFPGHLIRKPGLSSLHNQILRIPKKERKRLADANLRHVKAEFLSSAACHQRKLQ